MSETSTERFLSDYITDLGRSIAALPAEPFQEIVTCFHSARATGRTIFLCGNGGSALTASHLAVDLGKGASLGRKQGFRVRSLCDSIGLVTALSNDLDYSEVFVRQLEPVAEAGDVLLAFSASGESQNVLKAVEWSRSHGLITIGLVGGDGSSLARSADIVWQAATKHTGRIEDIHLICSHLLAYFFIERGSEPSFKTLS